MTLIKSISGIRGTIGGEIGENLTPLDLVKFTAAYAKWIKNNTKSNDHSDRLKIVVGRDARISGQMVQYIVEGTLMGCGIDVISLGLASTPTVELAVTELNANGGLILTASHNPKQWNALKLLGGNGEFLNDQQGKQILALAESQDLSFSYVDDLGSRSEVSDFDQRHIDMVLDLPLVDAKLVASKRFKVVVDAVNSVGGVIIPMLLRQMGAEVIELNCTPDGKFAHNPEPLAENLTDISKAVVDHKADLGIVVDPDVDRLALIQPNGEMFGEEYTLVAVADYVLSRTPGNTVSNLSSSRALADITSKYDGCQYASAAVGEVNVVEKMKQTNAIIGGEGNGGVIYPELHYGRDALVGVGLILTLLAQKDCTLSDLRRSYPEYVMSKNKIELTPEINVDQILDKIKEIFANERITDIDGVKIDFADQWVHLRKSNTEPIIRIYTEANSTEKAESLALQFIDQIRKIANI